MYRGDNQHQAPLLPELPALWVRLHGGRELQSVAHRDQRSSSLRTVSSLHFGILFFSASHSSRHLLIPKLFKLLIFSSRLHLYFFQCLFTI